MRAIVLRRLALIGLRFAIDNYLASRVSSPSMVGCKSDGGWRRLRKCCFDYVVLMSALRNLLVFDPERWQSRLVDEVHVDSFHVPPNGFVLGESLIQQMVDLPEKAPLIR